MTGVTVIVQARTGSTRLPGKVLAPVAGMPMLELMLRRLERLTIGEIVVATTVYPRDDAVAEIGERLGVAVVRGPEHDVLARFVLALDAHPAPTVVRLTADCPLIDPAIVEAVVTRHHDTAAAYTSNVLPRTFPKGLDVEVAHADALRVAGEEAGDPVEREHVTPFVYRRPERFPLANLRSGQRLGAERWTVDEPGDLDVVRAAVDRAGDIHAPWRTLLGVLGRRAPQPKLGELALRPAEGADAGRVLAWRNDADAVRWSASGRAVDSIEHARWYAHAIDDPGRRIWIGEVDGEAVGMVRVDVQSGVGTVSVTVAPQERGLGHGTALLRALDGVVRDDCQVRALVAHVRPANTASLRAFSGVGYESGGVAPDGLVRLVHRSMEEP
jgi:spore coat polysaccharide biosynthesis protein SpsF